MLILSGHKQKVHTLAFSPDGMTLASVAGHGYGIWLWDVVAGRLRSHADHDRRVVSVAFPGGESSVFACSDSMGFISFWSLETGQETAFDQVIPLPNHPVRLVFSPGGEVLAATGQHGPAQLTTWVRGWTHGVTLWNWQQLGMAGAGELNTPGRGVTCCAFSPDGGTLAVGNLDDWVYFHDLGLPELLRQRVGVLHGQVVHYIAYSPTGESLVSANMRGLVKVWDAKTHHKRSTLKGQGRPLHAIAFSPDGSTLATASGDGIVRFWDPASGKLRRSYDWNVGRVHSVAFSPDGLRAAAGGDRDIMVWDIDEWS